MGTLWTCSHTWRTCIPQRTSRAPSALLSEWIHRLYASAVPPEKVSCSEKDAAAEEAEADTGLVHRCYTPPAAGSPSQLCMLCPAAGELKCSVTHATACQLSQATTSKYRRSADSPWQPHSGGGHRPLRQSAAGHRLPLSHLCPPLRRGSFLAKMNACAPALPFPSSVDDGGDCFTTTRPRTSIDSRPIPTMGRCRASLLGLDVQHSAYHLRGVAILLHGLAASLH